MNKSILFIEINPGMRSSGAEALKYCLKHNIKCYVLTSNKQFYNTPDGNPLDNAYKILEFSTNMDDRDECVNFIREKLSNVKLNLIMSFSELYVEFAAYVGKRLGIPNNNYDSIHKARNKYVWRNILHKNRLSHVKSLLISNYEELDQISKNVEFPCVIKPVDGSASVSVQYCTNIKELRHAFHVWQKFQGFGRGLKLRGEMIVESYLPGPLYSIECLNVNGENRFFGITDRKLSGAPFFVETGASFPIDKGIPINEIIRKTSYVINLLGFKNSALHIEFILGPNDSIEYVDINPRLGGGLIPEMIKASLNINPIEMVINTMLGVGDKISIPTTPFAYCASRYVVSRNWGKITKITGLDKVKNIKNIHAFNSSVKVGGTIFPLTSDKNTLFEYFIADKNISDANKCADDVINMIRLDLKADLII